MADPNPSDGIASPSLYTRFTQVLPQRITPTPQDSDDYFSQHPHKSKNHAQTQTSPVTARSRSSSSASVTSPDDEEDTAAPSEPRSTNYFLNLLTTASVYSGIGIDPVHDVHKIKDALVGMAAKAKAQASAATAKHVKVPFYGVYANSSDEEDEKDDEDIHENQAHRDVDEHTITDIKPHHTKENQVDYDPEHPQYLPETPETPETPEVATPRDEIRVEEVPVDLHPEYDPKSTNYLPQQRRKSEIEVESGNLSPFKSIPEPFENSVGNEDFESVRSFYTSADVNSQLEKEQSTDQEPAGRLSSTQTSETKVSSAVPSVDNRTTFQQSVVENLNPHLIRERFLTKLKDGEIHDNSDASIDSKKQKLRLLVAEKIQKVFEIDDDDYFCGNYSTWLVKDVFLQGHLYLTKKCVLFFAFLPKRYSVNFNQPTTSQGSYTTQDDSTLTIQSGSLGLKTAKYGETVFTSVITHRYWAILRPQTLSIYSSSTDLHFPSIVIDLKSCSSAEIMDKDKEPTASNIPPKLLPKRNSGEVTSTPRFLSGRTSSDGSVSPRFSTRKNSNEGITSPKIFSSHSSDLSADDESYFSNMLNGEPMEPTEDNIESSSGVWFKLVSKNKTYKFHTDNLYTARQWCHNLTKIIFQLNNSNAGNEVLIKIPIESIVDFDRIGLLGHSEEIPQEVDDPEDELPMSVRLLYVQNDEKSVQIDPKKLKRSSPKKQGNYDVQTGFGIEDMYFTFFDRGSEFYARFAELIQEHQDRLKNQSETSSISKKSERFRDKAKRMVRKESASSELTKEVPRSISTLRPNTSTSSIINQFTPINGHLSKSQTFTVYDSQVEYRPDCDSASSVSGSSSTLKKIGRTLTNPTKIFGSRKASDSISSTTSSSSFEKPEYDHISDISSPVQNANLPRPMSITDLKNLKMTFETSHKDFAIAESRYDEFKDHLSDNGLFSTQAEGIKGSMPLPGPLNLQDPSEYHPEEKKQTKFQSIKKSIKTFSNVSNMWSANPNHFQEIPASEKETNDQYYVTDETTRQVSQEHFEKHFSLSSDVKLSASYYAHLQKAIPIYGKLYLSSDYICFRSLLPGVSTKMILPLGEIENCYKEKGSKITYSGLVLIISNFDELLLEFSSQESRDDCESMILKHLELAHKGDNWSPSPHEWGKNYDLELAKQRLANNAPGGFSNDTDKTLATIRIENARLKMFEERINAASGLDLPIILEDSPFYKTEIRPTTSYNFVLLTIGSRGDVQPYIALGKGLIDEGHMVTIATHIEFKDWVEKHGIKFKEIAGDPGELMSLMVTHGSMSVGFLKEASAKFRGWIHELLSSSWEACQGADILIESPSAMGGVHIAEALGIPYMRAFTMPWTRTRAYPHAFIVPDQKKGGSYNYLTHLMFETVFWKGISGQINKWRVRDLGLPKTNLFRLQQSKIPFLYNVSPTIFPPSVDFPDWIRVTGYWFLDEGSGDDYKPPAELVEFMEQASQDNKKIIYIGFGSIVVNDAKSLTKSIADAVVEADVRCILNKGWSDRLSKKDDTEPEVELPPEIFNSGAIPHDWLFKRIDAAVHHGGSGTTGATLRAGLPTIIKPFFGDQFFYASRIEESGVGLALKKLNSKSLSKAITTVTTDLKIIERSKKLGQKIYQENGVLSAVETIYSELEYARNLILTKQKHNEHYRQHHPDFASSGAQTPVVPEQSESEEDDSDEDTEEQESDEDEDDSDEEDEEGGDAAATTSPQTSTT